MRTVAIVLGLALALLQGTIYAQGLPPRPVPTATPIPPAEEEEEYESAATGRITGTVIDLTSGAPVPGVTVMVGDVTVTSDANGNYDRSGLIAGSYAVALALDPARGTPAEAPVSVALAEGATVVQHLTFRSPLAPPLVAVALPERLPETGGTESVGWIVTLLGLGLIIGGCRIAVKK